MLLCVDMQSAAALDSLLPHLLLELHISLLPCARGADVQRARASCAAAPLYRLEAHRQRARWWRRRHGGGERAAAKAEPLDPSRQRLPCMRTTVALLLLRELELAERRQISVMVFCSVGACRTPAEGGVIQELGAYDGDALEQPAARGCSEDPPSRSKLPNDRTPSARSRSVAPSALGGARHAALSIPHRGARRRRRWRRCLRARAAPGGDCSERAGAAEVRTRAE